MCFATNQLGNSIEVSEILKVIKPSFPIRDDSIFDRVKRPSLNYAIFKYEKNIDDDMILNLNLILQYDNT